MTEKAFFPFFHTFTLLTFVSEALTFFLILFFLFFLFHQPCSVHFIETLHALAGRVAGVPLPLNEEFEIHRQFIFKCPQDEENPKYMVRGRETES